MTHKGRVAMTKIANPQAFDGVRWRVRDSHARHGLSLLELMLAIGLGFVLLGAIYASIDQVVRQTTNGKVEMERLQIARAVFRRIELDLRAAMFDAASAVSDSDAASSSSSTSSGEGSTTIASVTNPDDLWTGSLGIRGTANELWIDLSLIRRQIDFDTQPEVATSDLKTVVYFLTGIGRESSSDDVEAETLAIADEDGIGLARSEGDRSVLRALNSSVSAGTLPGPTETLAPEIDRLTFRYFDGLSWYEEWDSASAGALPRAVEVVVGLEPAPVFRGYLANSAVSASTETFRMVIAIPVSDPLSAE